MVEKCGTVEVGMPLFMDDVNTTTHQADNIRKSIRNCSQMEIQKKYTFGLKKTKYMIIDEEMGAEQIIEKSVGKGVVQRISQYKYVGIHINELGNLNLHVDKIQERAMNVIK